MVKAVSMVFFFNVVGVGVVDAVYGLCEEL